MGPASPLRNIVDSLKWAQRYSLVTLPMVLNGPSVALEKYCQLSQMGPVLLFHETADGLEWAQHPLEKCCQQYQMDPVLLFWETADGLEWAQHPLEKCCLWPQMGPVLLLGDTANGLEWAQRCP